MLLIINYTAKLQIIGLTGGIGCGKSTVSNILRDDFKLYIIDCDILARRVVEVGKPAYTKIVKLFGEEVINPKTKEIDRKLLGKVVFANENLRKQLTQLTGFYIMLEIIKEIFYCVRTKQQLVVLDAPLLFESKYLKYICYPILVIYMQNQEKQIERMIKRDECTKEEALQKIKSQWPIERKIMLGDLLVNNDGTVEQMRSKVVSELAPFVV